MTDRDILIELLAIKLWEHTPLASGEPNRESWVAVDPVDKQDYRDLIASVELPDQLYTEA